MNEEAEFLTQALLHAANEGYAEKVRTLLEAGASVDAADVDGWTPLMIAAAAGHTVTVHVLVDAGADINASAQGQTALMVATEHRHFAIAEALERTRAMRELKQEFARRHETDLGGVSTRP